MAFNWYRYGSSLIGRPSSIVMQNTLTTSGVWDLNGSRQNLNGGATDISSFNQLLSAKSYEDGFSDFMTTMKLVHQGDPVCWATPTHTNNFESLAAVSAGTGDVTADGKFNQDAFINANGDHYIKPSNFPGLTQGCLWYAMTVFRDQASTYQDYMGTVFINFRSLQQDGTKGLKDIFYPSESGHYTECLVIHGGGSEDDADTIMTYNSPDSGTSFSRLQNAGSNGYYGSNFSQDSGIWGYREGVMIDGKDGPVLGATTSAPYHCYGIQNFNSTDSSASTLHWKSTQYTNQNYRIMLWTEFS